jgi:hypothetical protein
MLKKALYTSALLLPLGFLATAPAMADVSVGVGFGSPYYGFGYYPSHRYYDYGLYDPYGPGYGYGAYYNGRFDDDDFDDDDVAIVDTNDDTEVVEPASAPAEPTGCVKTNVKNFKNACSR